MLHLKIFSYIFVTISCIFGSSSFSYLEKVIIDSLNEFKPTLRYNKNIGELILKKEYDKEVDIVYWIVYKFLLNNDTILVEFSNGLSDDPGFLISRINETGKKKLGVEFGINLIIPGNKYLYISGHTNNYYNQRKKFVIENDSLIEINQAFYYVGLKSKTNIKIIIHKDTTFKDTVATLPKNTSVEVILDNGKNYYLIKTPFGLLGWANLDPYDVMKDSYFQFIKGLFYRGD